MMAMAQRMSPLARLFATDEPENDWRSQAACRGIDPELFFSSDEISNRIERQEREGEAKAVCNRCAVRNECLSYALAAGERYGIWGGLNPQERRAAARGKTPDTATERVS
jgi:WhiB family transcriptional regulator, redox-sensing transcriptional regulator